MKTINIKELKEIQIAILNDIDKFCKKNQIKYWLDYGTLIGAIRHSGYIPWDDDIDIGMLREDYDKFIKTYNNQATKYKLLACENDNDYYFPFAKVIDLTGFNHSAITHIYRTEGFTGDTTSGMTTSGCST